MKLPVNPDVVRVCIKFYAYLKKVQVEAMKTLIRFKKEVKEYVRLIAPWLARPVQESLRLPLVKTPEDRWKEAVKIWPWQLVFLEQFLSGAPPSQPHFLCTETRGPAIHFLRNSGHLRGDNART